MSDKLSKRLETRITPPEDLGELAREILAATRSDSTRTAYRLDWERFCNWAKEHKCEEYPITSHVLGAYLVWLHGEGYSKATIRRTVTVFRLAHDERDDPTGDRPIRAIIAGIMRKDKRPSRKAKPMLFGELQAICEALSASPTPRNIRDRALISLGWVGALRASELVALNYDDVTEVSQGLEIRIRESKTNKTGESEMVAVPYLKHEYIAICPVRNLMPLLPDYDEDKTPPRGLYAGLTFGEWPIFTGNGSPKGSRMSERTIERALQRACELAGIKKRFTSHSLRRGFATFAAHRGITEYALMAHGRWKTSAVAKGYIEKAKLWTQNPIKDLLG